MLYYNFKNYEEFNTLFGIVKHGNNCESRKNKILLAYLKDKNLLHQAVENNDYTFLHIADMTELENRMTNEILVSGNEDKSLPYKLHLKGKTYHSSIYETDEYLGICEDRDPKCIRYYNHKTGKIFKMKAGKLYRHLILETEFGKTLPKQVITYLCEEFAAKWQSYTTNKLPKNKLYVNQNFERIYSSDCCEGDFHSCMVDRGYHGFYEHSVKASAAYLENEEGKIIARCIIFNEVKDQYGKVYRLAERQYSTGNNDVLKRALVDALINGNYIDGYKKVGASCNESNAFVGINGESLGDRRFRIACDLGWYDDLSYQDSFKSYAMETRIAANYCYGDLDLATTEGCLDDSDEDRPYDDYHERYCDETILVFVQNREYNCDADDLDDFVWIDELDEYHHKDDVVSCDNCDRYHLREDSYYSTLTEEYYCCESCMEKAEKKYKKENWTYSDYDDDYFEDETDLTHYLRWNQKTESYEERSISESSLIELLRNEEFYEFDNVYFDRIDPATNLPYGYKLIKSVA